MALRVNTLKLSKRVLYNVPVTVTATATATATVAITALLMFLSVLAAFPSPIHADNLNANSDSESHHDGIADSEPGPLNIMKAKIANAVESQAQSQAQAEAHAVKILGATDLYCTRRSADRPNTPGWFACQDGWTQGGATCFQNCDTGYSLIGGVCWNFPSSYVPLNIPLINSIQCPGGYIVSGPFSGGATETTCYGPCPSGYQGGEDISPLRGPVAYCYQKCPTSFPHQAGLAACASVDGAATPYGYCPFD